MNVPDSHEVSYLIIVRIINKFNTLLRMTFKGKYYHGDINSMFWLVLAMLATSLASQTNIKLEPEVFRDGLVPMFLLEIANQVV